MRTVLQYAGSVLVPVVLVLAADPKPAGFAVRQKPYFSLMKVEEACQISRGGSGCEIGVIDSGFDFFHPALHANLKPGWFAPGFYHTNFATMDAHGTEVAGLIATRRAEGEDGMWGMAPGYTIVAASMGMPIHGLVKLQSEFFAKNPKAWMADLQKEMSARKNEIEAFRDAWLDYVSQTLSKSTQYLTDRGIRVINHSGYLDLSLFKTFGPWLKVVAPIENIVVLALHEPAYYDWHDTPLGPQKANFEAPYEVLQWSGTSSAAPQSVALAALVRTIRPDLKAGEVIRLIEQGADDIGAAGFDEDTGHGRLNFLRTLQLARETHGESF